jgi:hypothetical protein
MGPGGVGSGERERRAIVAPGTAGEVIEGIKSRQTVIQRFVCLPAGDAMTG